VRKLGYDVDLPRGTEKLAEAPVESYSGTVSLGQAALKPGWNSPVPQFEKEQRLALKRICRWCREPERQRQTQIPFGNDNQKYSPTFNAVHHYGISYRNSHRRRARTSAQRAQVSAATCSK